MYHFTPNLNICVHYCCKKCQKPTFSFRLKNEILILTEAVIKKKKQEFGATSSRYGKIFYIVTKVSI